MPKNVLAGYLLCGRISRKRMLCLIGKAAGDQHRNGDKHRRSE